MQFIGFYYICYVLIYETVTMLRKTLLLMYLLLIGMSYTLAQDIRNSFYYSPHINEGLSQLSVRVIHQDSRGSSAKERMSLLVRLNESDGFS